MNVLFLCTGNSARSILAEASLNARAHGDYTAFSAGSHPKSAPHPLALELLERHGIPTAALTSKSWDVFAAPDAPVMDIIITVCDQAAGEMCPLWPGQPIAAHWGVEDPAAVQGTEDEKRRAFLHTYTVLTRRIDMLLALPPERIERLTLGARLRDIGKQR